jgi:hypothetical protein
LKKKAIELKVGLQLETIVRSMVRFIVPVLTYRIGSSLIVNVYMVPPRLASGKSKITGRRMVCPSKSKPFIFFTAAGIKCAPTVKTDHPHAMRPPNPHSREARRRLG